MVNKGLTGLTLDIDTRASLIRRAQSHHAIDELWLFGSHAKGTATEESDVDLAIALAPEPSSTSAESTPLGQYVARADEWRRQVADIVGRPISFGMITPGDEMDREIRATNVILSKRTYS